MSQCTSSAQIGNPINCVAKFVTSEAVAAAQWYFDCPNLNGAELENQMTTPCDFQGSHWEQRIFGQDFLGSYLQHRMVVSPMTVAVMVDSGWYTSDYTATDWLREKSDYGFRQGCTFATSKCVTAGVAQTNTPAHFYTSARGANTNDAVCVPDARAVSFVTTSTGLTLEPQFQYFPSDSTLGGTSELPIKCGCVASQRPPACFLPIRRSDDCIMTL